MDAPETPAAKAAFEALSRRLTLPAGVEWVFLKQMAVGTNGWSLDWVACFSYNKDWFLWESLGRALPRAEHDLNRVASAIQAMLAGELPRIREADAVWRAGSNVRPEGATA